MMEHKNPFPKFLKIASFFPDTSIIRKWGVLSIALLLIFLVTWGHVEGDYQTRATGDWNDYNTWQVRSLGSWSNCGAGDYPGATAGALTVYITGGSTVSVIADVPNSIGALVFISDLTG